jgi:hypothetical protein
MELETTILVLLFIGLFIALISKLKIVILVYLWTKTTEMAAAGKLKISKK